MALRVCGGLGALIVVCGMQAVSAAIVFEQNFNTLSDGTSLSGSGLTEANSGAGNANYELSAGALKYTSSSSTSSPHNTGVSTNASAVLQANLRESDLTDPENPTKGFTITTNFVLDSYTATSASTVNFGFALFGANPNFSASGSGNTHYRVLFTPYTSSTSDSYRTLSIAEVASAAGNTATAVYSDPLTTTQLTALVGELATLTINGYYTGSTLNLQASLSYGTTTLTTPLFSDSTALTGTNFGYRTAINAQSGSSTTPTSAALNVTYDNLQISTIPEPGTWLGLGLLVLAGGYVRRRQLARV